MPPRLARSCRKSVKPFPRPISGTWLESALTNYPLSNPSESSGHNATPAGKASDRGSPQPPLTPNISPSAGEMENPLGSGPEESSAPAQKAALSGRGLWPNLLLLLISVVVAIGLAEGVLRVFFAQNFSDAPDERVLMYRYDRVLGWFPVPGSRKQ